MAYSIRIRLAELNQHILGATARNSGPLARELQAWFAHYLGTNSKEAGIELDEVFFPLRLEDNSLVMLDGLDEAPSLSGSPELGKAGTKRSRPTLAANL